VNAEAFPRLLELLSSDAEEAGRCYKCLQEKLTGFFNMKGITDPVSAADEAIDRAALNIAAGADVPDVDKYCMGIARNVAKERFRLMYREDSVFREFADDVTGYSGEQVDRIYTVLKPCFEQLAAEEQTLLREYCREARGRARAEQRRQLAETMKITVLALRIRVTRLRSSLADCARKRSRNE
jgi:hypothetical protein